LFVRAMVVDSFVYFRDGYLPQLPRLTAPRLYRDLQTACARFRLMPDQPSPLTELHAHVARHSVRQTKDGWTWKFDPAMPANGNLEMPAEDFLPAITVRTDIIYGQHSKVVDRRLAHRVAALLPNTGQPIEVPHSHHHLMLDQPLALVTALRTLLAVGAGTS
jgi:pimeloyl-ACP methyl ester carboxylesterase